MLKKLPLTLKLLIVSALAALSFGYLLDNHYSKQLYHLYESELIQTLNEQARVERIHFDQQLKSFIQMAKVASSYAPLIHHLATDLNTDKTLHNRPKWFPGRSHISTANHPKLILLLHNDGEVHSTYKAQLEIIPESLSPPSQYVRNNSINQTLLTMLDGHPWVLSSARVFDRKVQVGYVMLASPLDSDFLANSHRYVADPNITALIDVTSKTETILTSSDPDIIKTGTLLSEIEEQYLVTGRQLFDYGSSDLPLNFISLRSKSQIDSKLIHVTEMARQQRTLQSIGLSLVFFLVISWLARRMRKLSKEVNYFARQHLGVDISHDSADSLYRLEQDLLLLEKKVVEVHEQEILREQSETQKVSQMLISSEQRMHEFFELAEEMILSFAPDGQLLYANRSCLRELGYSREEISCVSTSDYVAIDMLQQHQQRIDQLKSGAAPGLFNSCFVGHQGQRIEVEISMHGIYQDAQLVEGQCICRNITARIQKEREEQERKREIEHAQRLESLGVMAGGIAHDFNNLLTSIIGNAALAGRALPEQSKAKHQLNNAIDSAYRGAELCRQMLAYAGKGEFTIKPLNLSEMMEETIKLLRISISKKVELQCGVDPELPYIMGDVAQIQQVMMNLVINASEAIGDQPGQIIIRSGSMYASTQMLEHCIGDQAEPGDYVWFEITDNGCGMDQATQARIFEPFFTTKFSGRGLGMSAILGIIKAHRGALKLISKPGFGTTFTILFPVHPMPVTERADSSLSAPLHHFQGKTVLIVDDEEHIREIASELLEEMELNTLCAGDGEEGIRLFRQHKDKIDLVLLDLTMPKLNGEECCKGIRELDSTIPVIIASGYSSDTIAGQLLEDKHISYIQKPYDPFILQHLVDTLISGSIPDHPAHSKPE